jgi:hypothetical protein
MLFLNIFCFISGNEKYGVSVAETITLVKGGTPVGHYHLAVNQKGILVTAFRQPELEHPGVSFPTLLHFVAGRVPLIEGADQAH